MVGGHFGALWVFLSLSAPVPAPPSGYPATRCIGKNLLKGYHGCINIYDKTNMPIIPKEPIIHKSKHFMAQFNGIVHKMSNLNQSKPQCLTSPRLKWSYIINNFSCCLVFPLLITQRRTWVKMRVFRVKALVFWSEAGTRAVYIIINHKHTKTCSVANGS